MVPCTQLQEPQCQICKEEDICQNFVTPHPSPPPKKEIQPTHTTFTALLENTFLRNIIYKRKFPEKHKHLAKCTVKIFTFEKYTFINFKHTKIFDKIKSEKLKVKIEK